MKYAVCIKDWEHSKIGDIVSFTEEGFFIRYACERCTMNKRDHFRDSKSKWIQFFRECSEEELKQFLLETI